VGRAHPALRAPTDAILARIPTLAAQGEQVARVTWAEFISPWYFHNRSDEPDEANRFDLARPHGTCHFARDPVPALIERLSDPEELEPCVPYQLLERLTVWHGTLDLDGELADMTARASRIPIEIGTVTPYELPWAYADELHTLGRVGLRWTMRFDPAASRGVAVFGPASDPDELPDATIYAPLAGRQSATRFLDELSEVFDIGDVPTFAELDLVEDPM
jgi:hypothetical protein